MVTPTFITLIFPFVFFHLGPESLTFQHHNVLMGEAHELAVSLWTGTSTTLIQCEYSTKRVRMSFDVFGSST